MEEEQKSEYLDGLERHVMARIDEVADSETGPSQYDSLQRKAIKDSIMDVFEKFLSETGDVGASKAVAAAKRNGTGAGTGANSDPYVSGADISEAIKGAGGTSDGEATGESGETAIAKTQNESTRKAAVALVKKKHDKKEQSKVLGPQNAFDRREHTKEIRETANTLRRLKVIRGKATPQNAEEKHLANLEGDNYERAVATQKRMLPDVEFGVGGIAAAVKSNGTERPDQDDQDGGGYIYSGNQGTWQRGGSAISTGDGR